MAKKIETVEAESVEVYECIDGQVFTRSYNTIDHGKDAEKLAKSFCEKKGLTLRKA